MAITAAGVGSGLDIENIVSQLMTIERQPICVCDPGYVASGLVCHRDLCLGQQQ